MYKSCRILTYVKNSAEEPGKGAKIRENIKIKIYEIFLSDHYHFEPVCVLILGS